MKKLLKKKPRKLGIGFHTVRMLYRKFHFILSSVPFSNLVTHLNYVLWLLADTSKRQAVLLKLGPLNAINCPYIFTSTLSFYSLSSPLSLSLVGNVGRGSVPKA